MEGGRYSCVDIPLASKPTQSLVVTVRLVVVGVVADKCKPIRDEGGGGVVAGVNVVTSTSCTIFFVCCVAYVRRMAVK